MIETEEERIITAEKLKELKLDEEFLCKVRDPLHSVILQVNLYENGVKPIPDTKVLGYKPLDAIKYLLRACGELLAAPEEAKTNPYLKDFLEKAQSYLPSSQE